MKYDFKNGYVAIHTKETVERLNDRNRTAGRPKIRYDVCLRDGNLTVVHHNITFKELAIVKAEIEKQSNRLW